MIAFRRGHVFFDPSDHASGYVLLSDVCEGDIIAPEDFAAFGGAAKPIAHEPLPDWLADILCVRPEILFDL